ncbi:MAG TPA: peptidoglycan-binding domain-containing protein, partial [Thermoanaerobaculia bacterium]|nr:peptidoglycan-binding domain-containing protein [Thermoanaerobaculia bacterium]
MVTIESLSFGAQGGEVRWLQQSLLRLGHFLDLGEQDGERFGASTRAAVAAFRQRAGLAGEPDVVDAALWAAIDREAAAAPWLVVGRVVDYDGPPLDLRLSDVQLRGRDLLAAGATATDGRFRLELAPTAAGRAMNLQVEAFRGGGESPVAVSALRFAAGPFERIDLTAAAGALPSELELLESRLGPVLRGLDAAALEPADVEFASRAASVGPELLRCFAAATRSHRQAPEIALRHWYAFHRSSPEVGLEALALHAGERTQGLLAAAVARGCIAPEPPAALAAAAAALRALGIRRAAERLVPLFAAGSAALDVEALESLLGDAGSVAGAGARSVAPEGAAPSDLAAAVHAAVPLLVMAGFDPALAGAIREQLAGGVAPAAMAALGPRQWAAAVERYLDGSGTLPPEHARGRREDSIAAYAASLAAASERLFVTQAFAGRWSEPAVIAPELLPAALASRRAGGWPRLELSGVRFANEPERRRADASLRAAARELTMFPAAEPVGGDAAFENSVRANTSRFLAAAPGFDLAATPVRDFAARRPVAALDELAPADREAVVGQVELMQRLLPIAPGVQQTEALLGAGLHSATQVA